MAEGILGFCTFTKGISSKVNVTERLEFELTPFDSAVQNVQNLSELHSYTGF